jgi:hypothetical protein
MASARIALEASLLRFGAHVKRDRQDIHTEHSQDNFRL